MEWKFRGIVKRNERAVAEREDYIDFRSAVAQLTSGVDKDGRAVAVSFDVS
jgi:hypothetical protein